MPTPTNIQSELDRHRASNAARVQQLVAEQHNTEITRAFELMFTSGTESDSIGLGRLLFAKGMRLLEARPDREAGSEWQLRVGVKRSLRELTADDFTCDLITLASGVHSCFQTWDFLADTSAEESQPHPRPAEAKGSPTVEGGCS